MKDGLSAPDHAACSRGRSVITTLLLIMIVVMIVRDIFVRRWSATTPAASDLTQRSGEIPKTCPHRRKARKPRLTRFFEVLKCHAA